MLWKKLLGGVTVVTVALFLGCAERTPFDPTSPEVGVLPGADEDDLPIDLSTYEGDRTERRFGDVGGVNVASGGTGLREQPSSFAVDVPVSDAEDIAEAWLYWCGRARHDGGDDTIVLNGTEYTGDLVASFPHSITPERWAFVYRLDASSLVSPGLNSFDVSGFDLGEYANEDGIGLVVLYEDPENGYAEVEFLELADFFYYAAPETGGNSAVHSFEFPATDVELDANLLVFVGDCEEERPDVFWWEIGPGPAPEDDIIGSGVGEENVLNAAQGAELDILSRELVLLPETEHVSFQIESPREGDGDSGIIMLAVFCRNSEVENVPPVCDAGGPYEGIAGELIDFDGSGSTDPDGEIIAYRWDFGDGETGVGVEAQHAYAEPGEYTVKLCVEDDQRLKSCCETTAKVEPGELVQCNAGGPYEGQAGESILFDATDSILPEGDWEFRWDFGDGSGDEGITVSHTYAESGEYEVELCITRARDRGRGEEEWCCVTEAFVSEGIACDAGGPYEGRAGVPVVFDGSGTTHPEGVSLVYSWDFGDDGTEFGEVVEHTYAEGGEYTVELCVWVDDGDGRRGGEEEICCETTASIGAEVVCDPGGPYEGTVSVPIQFDGSGTQDPDNLVVRYEWTFGDETGAEGVIVDHAYEEPAQYTATLCLYFEDETSECCPVLVIVTPRENVSPICDAGEDYYGMVFDEVPFDGSLSEDPDGEIVSWFWDFGDGETGEGETTSHTYHLPLVQAGGGYSYEYTVTLTVTDNDGAESSCTTEVELMDYYQNLPPVCDAGGEYKAAAGFPVELDGSFSYDPDGTIIQYDWYFGDGESLINGGPNPTHTYEMAGTFEVTLVVWDNFEESTMCTTFMLVVDVQ